MGNVLFRLPDLEQLSSELMQKFGTPQTGEVSRKDGAPLQTGLPSYLVEPLEYDVKNNEHVDEVQLVDFGECKYRSSRLFIKPATQKPTAFFVSSPLKRICTPLPLHLPELVFHHTLSRAVDIWNLGSTVRKSTHRCLIDHALISYEDFRARYRAYTFRSRLRRPRLDTPISNGG